MTKRLVPTEPLVALGASQPLVESYPSRDTEVGALRVSRALPVKGRRMIGPWCFLDRYGPLTFSDGRPMDVAPHPHIGLQTVTWLLEGEVVHDDSLGCTALVRPGAVNIMTSGRGIAHAERTPPSNTGRLNGIQLWAALPDAHRQIAPSFQHVAQVPIFEQAEGIVQVFAGEISGATSPACHYSEILGADVRVHPGSALTLPLRTVFEYAVLVLAGDCFVDRQKIEERALYYLGSHRSDVSFSSRSGGRLLLIGGPPFPEAIVIWWNFVARTPVEIATARTDWEEHRLFGEVPAYDGPRLPAPSLARLARPNPLS
jgi:redox-sensitive bicupin YhaK (pirin superfamily)